MHNVTQIPYDPLEKPAPNLNLNISHETVSDNNCTALNIRCLSFHPSHCPFMLHLTIIYSQNTRYFLKNFSWTHRRLNGGREHKGKQIAFRTFIYRCETRVSSSRVCASEIRVFAGLALLDFPFISRLNVSFSDASAS